MSCLPLYSVCILSKYVLWAVILVGFTGTTAAQVPVPPDPRRPIDIQDGDPSWRENGLPFFRNYAPKEYAGHPQNWWVAQNQQGVLYVANGDGLLEYDGARWHLTKTTAPLRSLAMGRGGEVYAGSIGEIGFFAPDSLGSLRYNSLLPYLDETNRDFTDVWQTFALSNGVYFASRKYLFRWLDGDFTVWSSTTGYDMAYVVGDELYVFERTTGLMRLEGEELVLDPGGSFFVDKAPRFMASYDERSMLIGTYSGRLFLYDGRDAAAFPTTADAYLEESDIYGGAAIPGGYYGIATMRGGMVLIDRSGNARQILDKGAGLQDNAVWYIYADLQGGLWLALNSGLARVETPAHLTRFSEHMGLEGGVESIHRHQGTLYVGTSRGVYYLTADSQEGAMGSVFRPVSGIENYSWSLMTAGNTLLAATSVGVYHIEGDQAKWLPSSDANRETVFHLYRSRKDTSIIYAAGDGIGLLKQVNGKWVPESRVDVVYEKIYRVAEDSLGRVWGGWI